MINDTKSNDLISYKYLLDEIANLDTLKSLTKVMVSDNADRVINTSAYEKKLVQVYTSFDKILVGLLLFHFASLMNYLKWKSKHNKSVR